MKKSITGFIGVGWIGGTYANDFERRGYTVIRYDKDKYKANKQKVKKADIVFVAVPTPSTSEGFDDSILIDAISNTVKGQIVVIKSTIQVGTTDEIQKLFPDRYILHSPEFLTEATAQFDAANPARNIIGYTEKSQKVAQKVMNVLPVASYETIVPCKEAELVKYAGNIWFYFKVMVCNLIYDVAKKNNIDYDLIKDMMAADKRIGRTHLEVIHRSGANKKNIKGRGAGGHCFIKDMEAFREMQMTKNEYNELCQMYLGKKDIQSRFKDMLGYELLEAMVNYNIKLLKDSNKDLDLLEGVYGKKER